MYWKYISDSFTPCFIDELLCSLTRAYIRNVLTRLLLAFSANITPNVSNSGCHYSIDLSNIGA